MAITELDYMEKYIGDFKIKGNEYIAKYCPFCNGGAHNDKYTFCLSAENHCYVCHRGSCNAKGVFTVLAQNKGEVAQNYLDYLKDNGKVYKAAETKKKADYTKPKFLLTEADNDIVTYFKNRGVSEDVTKKYVYTAIAKDGRKVAAFKFYDCGEHCLTKFRYIDARANVKETQEAEGKSVLWNLENIDKDKPVVLTEGMIDALSCIEAGYENVVSVPSGCNNFKWIDNNFSEIQNIKEWILYMDNDEAGNKMKENLLLKLDRNRIKVVEHDLKDANDELKMYGKDIVLNNIIAAKPLPVEGLVDIADIDMMDLSKVEKTRTGVEVLDKYLGGFMYPSLNVWTGKRGEGKSTLLAQCIIRAIEDGVKCFVYSGELSMKLFKLWLYRQIATEKHLVLSKNEITQQEYNAPPYEVEIAIDTWIKNKLYLYDDTIANDEDKLLDLMDTAYKRFDCKVFVLDNLTTVKLNANKGGKYEAQSQFTNRLREFVIKNKINLNLVVHPRKSNGAAFDNDTVGGSGDITNLAFSVINIRRIRSKDDLLEDEVRFYESKGINTSLINGMLEITKNRYFGETASCPLKFNKIDTRFSQFGKASDVITTWEKHLPNGYKDKFGKVYSNAVKEFVALTEEERQIEIDEWRELGMELVEIDDDCPF